VLLPFDSCRQSRQWGVFSTYVVLDTLTTCSGS